MASLAQSLMSELSEWELQNFLIDLDNQEDLYNHTNRGWCPVLVPKWWEGTPEEFLEEINSNIRLPSFTQDKSLAQQQSIVMEHLLNMWSEHLYHQED